MKNIKLSLLLPTYNEEAIIDHCLSEISKELGEDLLSQTEVIVVDDGTDDLPRVITEKASQYGFAQLKVLRNSPPLGKGKSLTEGFNVAQGEIVGFMDVDLSTPPHYIHTALESFNDSSTDIFIGSRRAKGAQVTREQFFLKDILGNMLGVVARKIIFQGMPSYQDTQCGFKFYRNKVAKILYRNLVAPDGLNDLEILLRANLVGYKVEEFGVEWTDLRESKRTLRRILVGEIKAIMRILWTYKVQTRKQRALLKAAATTEAALPHSHAI